jgi:hypothetical protein
LGIGLSALNGVPWKTAGRKALCHCRGPICRHEGRQVAALAAERVGHPRPDAREAVEREARRHLVLGRAVRVALGRHRVDEAHVVGHLAEHRQKVARHLAALAPRLELPLRLDEVALFTLERDELAAARHRHRRVVQADELRLVVERVDVGEGARAEDQEHVLRLRGEVRLTRCVRPRGVDGRADRALARQQPLLVKERRERHAPEARPAELKKSAPVEHPSAGVGKVVDHQYTVMNSLAL